MAKCLDTPYLHFILVVESSFFFLVQLRPSARETHIYKDHGCWTLWVLGVIRSLKLSKGISDWLLLIWHYAESCCQTQCFPVHTILSTSQHRPCILCKLPCWIWRCVERWMGANTMICSDHLKHHGVYWMFDIYRFRYLLSHCIVIRFTATHSEMIEFQPSNGMQDGTIYRFQICGRVYFAMVLFCIQTMPKILSL